MILLVEIMVKHVHLDVIKTIHPVLKFVFHHDYLLKYI